MRDFLQAIRVLRKRPGLTGMALLVLALGIGANTAFFSVLNAVLLRPLPYREPERIVRVFATFPGGFSAAPHSEPNFLDIRARNHAFQGVAAYEAIDVNLTGLDRPERLRGTKVSAGFFEVLGVTLALGRGFLPEEDEPGRGRVAVLGDAVWRRRFGGDPAIVGRSIILDGQPFLVAGVLPRSFQPLSHMGGEILLPLTPVLREGERGALSRWLLARLKPGVTLEQARADISSLARQLGQEYPGTNKEMGVRLVPLPDNILGSARKTLWVLFGAVGFVLLIACANVANLLLARAAERRGEMAVRASLGAARWRLIRQMMAESVVLSLAGGALGLLLAVWGVDLISHAEGGGIPRLQQASVDLRVMLFTAAASLLTGILFGLAPALAFSPKNLSESLRDTGARGTAGGRSGRIRGVLIVCEVALSVVLLVGAGLLIRTVVGLLRIDPGFRPENVLTMQFGLPESKYRKYPQVWEFSRAVLERVRSLPGVVAAGMTSKLPLQGGRNWTVNVEGRPVTETSLDKRPIVELSWVSTGYFGAMGIPLLQGRSFTETEVEGNAPVVMVNDTLARTLIPGENPLGKRIQKPGGRWMEIVGVVGDARQWGIHQRAIAETYEPGVPHTAALVVRAAVEPQTLTEAIRHEIAAVDKDQPVHRVATMEEIVSSQTATKRFYMTLLAAFAAIALTLAAVGIYGVISYSVTQRTQEIGIRVALGAVRPDVLRLVLREALTLIACGLVAGVAAALALTRYLASQLYGVRPTDAPTFAAVVALLGAVALAASVLPALRATRVDPMTALRYQ